MRYAYPTAGEDLARSTEAIQLLAAWTSQHWGMPIGSSIRPRDPYPDHRTGAALDVMTTDPTQANAYAADLIRLHRTGRCRIRSIITFRRRWTPALGWHPYRGSNPHTDHVHVWLDPEAGFNGAGTTTPTTTPYPLTTEQRGGKPCYYGPITGPTNWVGGYHQKDRDPIRHIQARLRQDGHQIAIDGIYGPQTEAAVRAYQARHHLTVDGLVGPTTWHHLMKGTP